jgi:hypothetical protein
MPSIFQVVTTKLLCSYQTLQLEIERWAVQRVNGILDMPLSASFTSALPGTYLVLRNDSHLLHRIQTCGEREVEQNRLAI